jgi:AcrR family transcriptional regulator
MNPAVERTSRQTGRVATESTTRRLERRDEVATSQWVRVLMAVTQLAGAEGVRALTIATIASRAGVSTKALREHFADAEECLSVAFDEAAEAAAARATGAVEDKLSWVERVRSGLLAMLTFFDEDPAAGRLLVVESRGLPGRSQLERQLVTVVDEGRTAARRAPTPYIAEAVVGGALTLVEHGMEADDGRPLVALLPALMAFITLPFLGRGASRHEYYRAFPLQDGQGLPAAPPANLPGIGPRLTFRSMEVIAAIGAHPGASNSKVSELICVTDQGYASRLLRRLAEQALIINTRAGQPRGTANAWVLTAAGEQVARAVAGARSGEEAPAARIQFNNSREARLSNDGNL